MLGHTSTHPKKNLSSQNSSARCSIVSTSVAASLSGNLCWIGWLKAYYEARVQGKQIVEQYNASMI